MQFTLALLLRVMVALGLPCWTLIVHAADGAASDITFSTVTVPGAGVTLRGYLYRPAARSRLVPAVLILPNANEGAENLDSAGRALAERGYIALTLAMRGSPGAEGTNDCGVRQVDDALAALQWLGRQNDADPSRIGIIGFGQSGQVALLTAARTQALKSVVVFAPITEPEGLKYATSSKAMRKYLNDVCSKVDVAAISPMAQWSTISAPVLFIHGARDETVPVSQSEMLYLRMQQAERPSELRELPDAGPRLNAEETEKAWSWVAGFLGRFQTRAASLRTPGQQERVNRFAERGWNLPLTRSLNSLQSVGKVMRQRVSTVQNPHVPGRLDELRELWFDGLSMEILIPGRKRDFLLQQLEVSKSRYRLLYGVRIGSPLADVQQLLGQPDATAEDYVEYMNSSGVGTARFHVQNDRVQRIEWEYSAD